MRCAYPNLLSLLYILLVSRGWIPPFESVGTPGLLVYVVAACVGLLGCVVMWFGIQEWKWKRKGERRFQATTKVEVDCDGFRVEGLGTMSWPQVLAIEYIPDSESKFIVHTSTFQQLMLEAPEALPVFRYYLELIRK